MGTRHRFGGRALPHEKDMKATRLGQKIGYARVSTDEQNLDLQIQALKSAGCDVIYTDSGISGSVRKRPGLTKALKSLRKGDKLVVWRLDRLGRSLVNLVQLLEELGKREIRFCSMCEHIDTSSSGGRLVFHMMAALAEFERSLISERTRAGMAAARARGQHVGRFPSMNTEQCLEAQALLDQGIPPTCVAKRFKVTPRTLIRLVQRVTKTSDAAPSSCADPANGDIENVAPRRAEDDTAVTPDPPPTETSTRRRKKPAPIEQDVVSTCASGTAPQRQLEAPIHEHYRTGSTHIWHPHIHPETLPCSSWPEDLNWEPDPLQPLAHTQHRVSRPIASAPDTSSCRTSNAPSTSRQRTSSNCC